jgi:hypothetical protein
MNLQDIIVKEPRLIQLIDACHHLSVIPDSEYWLKNEIWYKIVKPRMSKLVGWNCDDDEFKESEIYDMVYTTLTKIMGV